ncbi:MAG: outer membrane protein assembly factor BamB, partial [Verrucomicrobiales bacterium]
MGLKVHTYRSGLLLCLFGQLLNATASDWPTESGSFARTGYVDASMGTFEPAHLWSLDMGSWTRSPIIVDGRLYVTMHNRVFAVDAMTGGVIWQKQFPGSSISDMTMADDFLVFQHHSGISKAELLKVDLRDGAEQWAHSFESQSIPIYGSPVVVDGRIYSVGGYVGGLYGHDFETGAELFFHPFTDNGWTPTLQYNKILTFLGGSLREHDLLNGQVDRSITLNDQNHWGAASVVALDGKVYVTSSFTLYAFDQTSMSLDWSVPNQGLAEIPAVQGGEIFVISDDSVRAYNVSDGVWRRTYFAGSDIREFTAQPLITNDRLLVATRTNIQLFDRSTASPMHTIPSSGTMAMADGVLYVTHASGVEAWQVTADAGQRVHAPVAVGDRYQAYAGLTLNIPQALSVTNNDSHVTGSITSALLVQSPEHGFFQWASDGSFNYQPQPGFHGLDQFSYRCVSDVHTSKEATVHLDVLDTNQTYAVFEVFQDGLPVYEGVPVGGTVTGRVRFYNAEGQHVQFYKNFRTLKTDQHGHNAGPDGWERTFVLDTSDMYDGENLLSVHVHPHNVPGVPYQTDFYYATFMLVTTNGVPAPDGDWTLPGLGLDPEGIFVDHLPLAELQVTTDPVLTDDVGFALTIDQSELSSRGGQAITHIGGSVLGRFRWGGRTPPFAERSMFGGNLLHPFQRDTARSGRIVIFFSDKVGRANYAHHDFVIPSSSSPPPENAFDPLDAHILNLHQGEQLIIPEGESYGLDVLITGASNGGITGKYDTLFAWVGNRAVSQLDLKPHFAALAPGETSFRVALSIPSDEVKRLQEARHPGAYSTAFAVWLDFSTGVPTDDSLPSSEHVHLDSVRTMGFPFPYGPPTVLRRTFAESFSFTGHAELNFVAFGEMPEGATTWYRINEGPAIAFDRAQPLVTDSLPRGEHVVRVFLRDRHGVDLPNPEASLETRVQILNEPPRAIQDVYQWTTGQVFSITAAEGVLANDIDLEDDTLQAEFAGQARFGQVVLSSDGGFVYTPPPGFRGLDEFRYRASDGAQYSAEIEVLVYVNPDGLQPFTGGPWQMDAGDASHRSQVPVILGDVTPSLRWTAHVNPKEAHAAVAGDGKVFLTPSFGRGSTVLALDAATGQILWEQVIPDADFSPPAYVDGRLIFIYTVGNTMRVMALSGVDGRPLWSSTFRTDLRRSHGPTVHDGMVYCPSTVGVLAGFDLQTGRQLLYSSVPRVESWTPTAGAGSLLTFIGGTLYEYDQRSGVLLDRWETGQENFTAATVCYDSGLAFIAQGSNLHAVDPALMKPAWTRVLPDGAFSPAVHAGELFVFSGTTLYALDAFTGADVRSYRPGYSIPYGRPIITRDRVIYTSLLKAETYIFDRASSALLHTIGFAGKMTLAYNLLFFTTEWNAIRAYEIGASSQPREQPLITRSDRFTCYNDTPFVVPGSIGMFANDELDAVHAQVLWISNAEHGEVAVDDDGGFTYTPASGFTGRDTFGYQMVASNRYSAPTSVEIDVLEGSETHVLFELYQDGRRIDGKQPVSGYIDGVVKVINGEGQHVQFYKNFRGLEVNEHDHHIQGSPWERSFTLDSSDMYDGQNLLSAHVHPNVVSGEPFPVDFTLGLAHIQTFNHYPAPNGDTELPQVSADLDKISIRQVASPLDAAFIDVAFTAFSYYDDVGNFSLDTRSGFSEGYQAIAHLGGSVLGRRRWTDRTPPFATGELFDDVYLHAFQGDQPREARITIFISDEAGRANYGIVPITIPARSGETYVTDPSESYDARILNVSQGDTLMVPENGVFNLDVAVSGMSAPFARTFPTLTAWVGNRSVAKVSLQSILNQTPPPLNHLLSIPIPSEEIARLQDARLNGRDAGAFALWLDFSRTGTTAESLPTSTHVHLDGIHTSGFALPYHIHPAAGLQHGRIALDPPLVPAGSNSVASITAEEGYLIDQLWIHGIPYDFNGAFESNLTVDVSALAPDMVLNASFVESDRVFNLLLDAELASNQERFVRVYCKPGFLYQLQTSIDLSTWLDYGPPVIGIRGTQRFSCDAVEGRYYIRILETP